jgi:hypothetical protein
VVVVQDTIICSSHTEKSKVTLLHKFFRITVLNERRNLKRLPPLSIKNQSWALVAQAYDPSYSGSRDQEDHGLKPAWANSSKDPISKKPTTEKGLVQWPKV